MSSVYSYLCGGVSRRAFFLLLFRVIEWHSIAEKECFMVSDVKVPNGRWFQTIKYGSHISSAGVEANRRSGPPSLTLTFVKT